MIYRLSIYYYRYSLLWLRWEKCRSPIPLANFGTTPLNRGLARRPTKRALDKWDSARFSSSILASSFFRFQTASTPAHLRVTPAVGRQIV